MKKVISVILSLVLILSLIPVITLADAQTPVFFSWNFTTGKKYATVKVSGNSATSVSWGDYRAAFMAFPIPEDIEQEDWVISDNSMVFDNGRQSGQAPTVTIKMIDGDSLVDTYTKHSQGAITDAFATQSLASLRDNGKIVGTFSSLTSNTSSALSIGEAMKEAKESGKSYVGFYLTCRSEDDAASSGIVNFVNPTLAPAPEVEDYSTIDISLSPLVIKKGGSVTVTPSVSPKEAVITNAKSSDEEAARVAFTDTTITVTGINTGFSNIAVTVEFEDKTMNKSFFVSVTENNPTENLPSVTLFENGAFAPIIMDEGYSNNLSYKQIKRAVGDLKQDMALVSGKMTIDDIPVDDNAEKRDARLNSLDYDEITNTAIIVGSIESSEIIQDLILSGKLDEAGQIKGNWEGYVIKKVKNPIPGIENALVIAGSDTRGTIYGIYHLSEKMGVSPWYWWSDVAIETKPCYIFNEDTIVNEGPDVAYRGIFINDEEHFVEWCEHHFPEDYAMDNTEVNGPNAYIYNHMYELLLRLGANTLWPAMHEYTTAFNYDTDENGIPLNAKAASEYGIVMSSSHCEVMLRGNVGEWEHWYNQNKDKYNIQGSSVNAAFDYTLNKEAILNYWRERLVANKDFESIFVLGIRGVHDGKPNYANLSGAGYGSGDDGIVNMMKDVITEQRKMIKDIYGSEDAVPQVFIPYKEMNTYYNHNNGDLASWLPDDVIVMYAEDNFNYLRQTSTAQERAREGGLGIYYHNSYWGTPKSYLWLNSTSTTLMYEEMRKAYDTGAKKYWILNVGDLKPGELNCEFFMRMAWDVDMYDDTNIYTDYYKKQAMRDYRLSEADAEIYAAALEQVNSLIMTKKAEFFGYNEGGSSTVPYFPGGNVFPFSVIEHGDEGQIMVDKWNSLVDILGTIYEKLDDECKDSFYEQIYHLVLSYRNRNEEYVYYWKNQLYATQGRYASTTAYADLSRAAVMRLDTDQDYYNSRGNGKWTNILNYEHIIYYQRNQGALRVNESMYANASPTEGVGAVCEGQSLPTDNVTLKFNSLADNKRFIDIFGKNVFEEGYVIEADDFITLSKTSGNVYTEERITVVIDWDALTNGTHTGTITVFNADEEGNKEEVVATFTVEAVKTSVTLEENSYIEANGFVAIEAEHYSEMIEGSDGSYWAVVENLGQSGDGVKGFPDLAEKVNIYETENAAQLVYRIYFESTGTFTGTLYRLPTLNEGSENNEARSCNVAVGLRGEYPALLSGNRDTGGTWGANVMRGYEPLTFSITIPEKGYYDIVVYKIDASIAFDRIVIETTSADSSHVGPPESPNSIAEIAETVIGNVPEYVKNVVPAAYITPIGNLNVAAGTVNEVKITKPSEAIVTFKSLNPSVAEVEFSDDILTIYGLKAGTATVKVNVAQQGYNDGEQEFTVFVTDGIAQEGYKEENGELVINTADVILNNAYASHTNISTHTWATSGKGIAVSPNSGINWTNASTVPATAPYITFKAEFETAGNYYVAVNLSSPDDGSDSFHFGLNGKIVFSSNSRNNRPVIKVEEWFSHSSWVVTIPSAGEHTITLYAREDGLVINQIYMSQTNQIADGSTGNLKPVVGGGDVLPSKELTDEERVALDIRFANFGYDLSNVYGDVNMPKKGVYSSSIEWQSSKEDVISIDGKVTIPKHDTLVTLTGNFTCGDIAKTVTYSVIVKKPVEVINSENGFNLTAFTPFSTHSYISFDLIATEISDGFVGVCQADKNPTAYGSFPICFRICPDGYFDAHNGTEYAKVDTVYYEKDKAYRVVMDIDVENQTYNVYVIADGLVRTVADNFSYRASATDFGNITVCPGSGVGEGLFLIQNLTVSSMPYTILDFSLNNNAFSSDIFYFGDNKRSDSVIISTYNREGEMTFVKRMPLSLNFGESYPVEGEISEDTACLNIMVLSNKFSPLAINKKIIY